MLTYKDRTWCNFNTCSKFNECYRALTNDVVAANNSACALLFAVFKDKPDCFVTKTIIDKGD